MVIVKYGSSTFRHESRLTSQPLQIHIIKHDAQNNPFRNEGGCYGQFLKNAEKEGLYNERSETIPVSYGVLKNCSRK